jgi:hypothetical protein
MTYSEFLESLLRMGVQAAGGAEYLRSKTGTLRDALLPTLVTIAGELEGASTKLNWERLQELIREEQQRVDAMKVDMMWDEFESASGTEPALPDAQVQWHMGYEAIFRRMLDALEREGDREAGRARDPPKRKNFLSAGKAVRLGVSLKGR